MSWQTIILPIILSFLAAVIGGAIVALVNYRFNKKFEIESRQRTEGAKIAALFAKWISFMREREEKSLNKEKLYDYCEELNKMSFELSLWIPEEQFKTINNELHKNEPKFADILIEMRAIMLNKKSKDLKADELQFFDPKKFT